MGPDPRLLIVFCSHDFDHRALLAAVAEAAPGVPVVGCSTAGELSSSADDVGAGDTTVVVTALGGPGFSIATRHAVAAEGAGLREAAFAAASCMSDVEPLAHSVLLVLSDGLAGDQEEVVRGAYRAVGATVPLVGGCAGDDLNMARTYQFHGADVLTDAVVAVAVSSDAPFGIGVRHGWRRVGEAMVVTGSNGNRVFSLDDQPALDTYLHRLGAPAEAYTDHAAFTRFALTHPLGISRRSGEEVRFVAEADFDDRSLVCIANVAQGGLAWFMEGDESSCWRRPTPPAARPSTAWAGGSRWAWWPSTASPAAAWWATTASSGRCGGWRASAPAPRWPASTRTANSPGPAAPPGSTTRPSSSWPSPSCCMSSVARDWLSHQLSEFLAAVSAYGDEAAALDGGVERLAEAVEAEVAAVVIDGRVTAAVGFRPGQVPHAQLSAVRVGSSFVDMPGLGQAAAMAVEMEDDEREARVVVLRVDMAFSSEEAVIVRGMARVLGLTVRLLRLLERERTSRQALQERQELLERLFRIQRSISHRAPIDVVLNAITEGAAALLDAEVVALRLVDEADSDFLRVAATVGVDDDILPTIARTRVGEGVGGRAVAEGRLVIADDYEHADRPMTMFVDRGLHTAMAAPVYRDGAVAGSLLVASYDQARRYSATEQEMLLAFAEHTSLALNDSSAVDAINRAYAEAVHRATHDELTGLPNRALVIDRLEHAMARSGRSAPDGPGPGAPGVCVLFVDLDRFKAINDSLGHSVGDEVLSLVASRLQEAVRPCDTVGRLSGDEFVVVCEDIGPSEAVRIAERVADAIARPVTLYGRDMVLTASVGVAAANPASTAEDVLRDADVAMYRAKERGRARIEVFDEAIRAQMLARIEMEHALRRAISGGELRLYYQPIMDAETGRLLALEALVRWQHPDKGLLSPDLFVPLAEDAGLIIPLGRWVVEEACRQVAEWRAGRSPLGSVRVSINLSARQFADAELCDVIAHAMQRHRLPGPSIGFEITESVLMEEAEITVATLRQLKRLGVHLAIDDFGTGYSSLSYLQRVPVDTVKIDRSFVDRMSEDGGSDVIVAAVVSLARALGLSVIAEGVETQAQLDRLRALECGMVQGYMFGRPQPPESYLSAPAIAARARV